MKTSQDSALYEEFPCLVCSGGDRRKRSISHLNKDLPFLPKLLVPKPHEAASPAEHKERPFLHPLTNKGRNPTESNNKESFTEGPQSTYES